jgi:glycosyltransferase involved in cell wall biosynthesis
MRKKLILITSGFPYGSHETFLETEINYLAEGFEHVQIIAVDPVSTQIRNIPLNCSVASVYTTSGFSAKLLAVAQLCSPKVWREWRIVRNTYKLPFSVGMCKTMLMSLQRAKQIAKSLQPIIAEPEQTVCYSYWCDDTALALCMLKEKFPDVKVVSRAHGWDVYFHVHEVKYLPFRHWIANGLDALFPISDKGKQYMLDTWKAEHAEIIQVSRLGVKAQTPVQFNEQFILVSCSNMISLKRIHLIIEALALIEDKEVNWVHFGDGPECDSLLELAKKILKPNIQWVLKGHVPNKKVLEWYAEHNPSVFINVSSSEGIPVSIMEAMSFGIPVVATDVGGTGEIVNDGNGVLLNPACSSSDLANSIIGFNNKEIWLNRSKSAYLTWERRYCADANYIRFTQQLSAMN